MTDPFPFGPVPEAWEPGFLDWVIAFVSVGVLVGCWLLFVRWWVKRHPEGK